MINKIACIKIYKISDLKKNEYVTNLQKNIAKL